MRLGSGGSTCACIERVDDEWQICRLRGRERGRLSHGWRYDSHSAPPLSASANNQTKFADRRINRRRTAINLRPLAAGQAAGQAREGRQGLKAGLRPRIRIHRSPICIVSEPGAGKSAALYGLFILRSSRPRRAASRPDDPRPLTDQAPAATPTVT